MNNILMKGVAFHMSGVPDKLAVFNEQNANSYILAAQCIWQDKLLLSAPLRNAVLYHLAIFLSAFEKRLGTD